MRRPQATPRPRPTRHQAIRQGNQAIMIRHRGGCSDRTNQAQHILACNTHAKSLHANQRNTDSLQVRGLTPHSVAESNHCELSYACERTEAGYMLWQTASESEVDSDDSISLAIGSILVGAISKLIELFGDLLLLENGNISQRSAYM